MDKARIKLEEKIYNNDLSNSFGDYPNKLEILTKEDLHRNLFIKKD